jgi:hypothetical protein
MSSLHGRKRCPSPRHHFAFTICEIEVTVIATLQETWAAHLLDIVARLQNVKTGMNVVVAVQEMRARS